MPLRSRDSKPTFLDLFAGAGGLSEGFIQAGFEPIAHVEADEAACYTLRTRAAYHWLNNNNGKQHYAGYLGGSITRRELYNQVPPDVIGSVINEEISNESIDVLFSKIKELLRGRRLDVIIGGPPCQAYSLAGRSRDKNRMMGDERNYLFRHYAAFLSQFKPRFFVFENVLGLLSAKDDAGSRYFDQMLSAFQKAGYQTEYRIVSAQNYGVLQKRERIILVGSRDARSPSFPNILEWHPKCLVHEVFRDLPELKAGEGTARSGNIYAKHTDWKQKSGVYCPDYPISLHVARPHNQNDLEIYKIAVKLWNKKQARLDYKSLPDRLRSHKHVESFSDRFKVVAANISHSQTVVAHIAKDGHYYIHPDIDQNRSITPREAARLQTFPDDYYFEGATERPSRTAAFKQIGNAVPVALSGRIGQALYGRL